MVATLGKRRRSIITKPLRPTATSSAITVAKSVTQAKPVSNVSIIATKSHTLGKRPTQSIVKQKQPPIETPPPRGRALGRNRPRPDTDTQDETANSGSGYAPLPYDNMPYVPEDQSSDEQQAYYEQSSDAEVPITEDNVFVTNIPPGPRPKPGVWQRIKDWFHDIFAGEEDISAPLTTAYIRDNVMHVASIVVDRDGAHYVVTRIPCPAARGKDGSVKINGENPQWLKGALQKAKYNITQSINSPDDRIIADVIERARAGDQNAYALIAMVRANAQKGNARAISTAKAMRNYLDKHPIVSDVGAELDNQSTRANKAHAAVVFANGKRIDPEVIRQFGHLFGNEAECFFQGARDWNKDIKPNIARSADPLRLQIYEVGQVLGRARAIQQMRRRDVPISSYDPLVGWELGE